MVQPLFFSDNQIEKNSGAVAAIVFLSIQYAKYHLDERSKFIVPEDEERRVLRDE